MRTHPHLFLALLVPLLWSSAGGAPEDEWQAAARRIHRIRPGSIKGLPKEILAELEKRGCTIPQPGPVAAVQKSSDKSGATEAIDVPLEKVQNIIKGQFAKKGQVDWVALCSKDLASSMLVLWGGPARCPSEMDEKGADANALARDENGPYYYDHAIGTIGPKAIQEYQTMDEGDPAPAPTVPPYDHDGIEDGSEKASVIFYCQSGTWLRLMGGD